MCNTYSNCYKKEIAHKLQIQSADSIETVYRSIRWQHIPELEVLKLREAARVQHSVFSLGLVSSSHKGHKPGPT
jgi:hypothetical protein